MRHLTALQRSKQEEFRRFVGATVAPFAATWDCDQMIPGSVICELAERGYLGCSLPADYGGQGADVVTFGLLNEALGRASSALTGVLTVQAMVSMVLLKWGTIEQKRQWLPQLASGKTIGAFALTEPGAGSAIETLGSEFVQRSDGQLVLRGIKKWISCGQFAGMFLVFGKLGGLPCACVVPRDSAGLHVDPISDLMGFRAAGLAQLRFED